MGTLNNGKPNSNGRVLRVLFNCSKCPAYCCSYARIEVTRRDLQRLARHLQMTYEQAERKLTKVVNGVRVLRHKRDHIFDSACQFLDTETRQCTVYDVRPGLCRTYPESIRCGYYDFLASERRRQQDEDFIPSA